MKILGIDFEPRETPAQRHLETLSATTAFMSMTALFVIGFSLTSFVVFSTPLWPAGLAYFGWIWLDQPATEKGGRRFDWVRDWKLFKYAADYYPISLIAHPDLVLDPKKNYLFGGFPHAIFPSGIVISLLTTACGVDKTFPTHTVFMGTLEVNLKAPLYRDFLMAMGFCSVSANSLNYILKHPHGGRIVLLTVGGAAETYLSSPGTNNILLKDRKGFVKLAIKTGAPLVPVYSFGEVDTFDQYISPNDSLLHKVQIWIKDATTIAFPLFHGRGIFQKTFGWAPYRKPINVLVGKPIPVRKNDNPSKEEVEVLHRRFMDELTELFEVYKHSYIDDAENKHLVML